MCPVPARFYPEPCILRATNRVRMAAAVFAITVHVGFFLMLINRPPDPALSAGSVMQVSLIPAAKELHFSIHPAPRDHASRMIRRPSERSASLQEDLSVLEAPARRADSLPPVVTPSDNDAAQVRRALKGRLGCANPDLVALTDAERAKCDERLGEDVANVRVYPVISPKLKKIFDRTFECKPDDDWCLYRVGKGPYPGLAGLGRTKKKSDWQ